MRMSHFIERPGRAGRRSSARFSGHRRGPAGGVPLQHRDVAREAVVSSKVASVLLDPATSPDHSGGADGKQVDVRVSETIAADRVELAYDSTNTDLELDKLIKPAVPTIDELAAEESSPRARSPRAGTDRVVAVVVAAVPPADAAAIALSGELMKELEELDEEADAEDMEVVDFETTRSPARAPAASDVAVPRPPGPGRKSRRRSRSNRPSTLRPSLRARQEDRDRFQGDPLADRRVRGGCGRRMGHQEPHVDGHSRAGRDHRRLVRPAGRDRGRHGRREAGSGRRLRRAGTQASPSPPSPPWLTGRGRSQGGRRNVHRGRGRGVDGRSAAQEASPPFASPPEFPGRWRRRLRSDRRSQRRGIVGGR